MSFNQSFNGTISQSRIRSLIIRYNLKSPVFKWETSTGLVFLRDSDMSLSKEEAQDIVDTWMLENM